jgi:hypothetical protein
MMEITMTKANNKLSRFAKRHYEAIAEAMQLACPSQHNVTQHDQWNTCRTELANAFVRDSDQFKRDRFINARTPGANVRARS